MDGIPGPIDATMQAATKPIPNVALIRDLPTSLSLTVPILPATIYAWFTAVPELDAALSDVSRHAILIVKKLLPMGCRHLQHGRRRA